MSCASKSLKESRSPVQLKVKKKADKESDKKKSKREQQELEYDRNKNFQKLHDKGATDW